MGSRQMLCEDFRKIFLHTELLVQDGTLSLYLDAVRNFSLKEAKCHKDSDRSLELRSFCCVLQQFHVEDANYV